MSESIRLKAQGRTSSGKGVARKLRAAGSCPAVLYGPGAEPRLLAVDPKALQKLLHTIGESSLLELEIGGEGSEAETAKVIVRELQFGPMRDVPDHVDFYRVSMDRTLSLTVALELTGVSPAVESKTGTMSQQTYEVAIECLPGDIPSKIEVDVSGLDVGDSLHISDLTPPRGVSITDNPEVSVVSISAVKEVEEEEEVAPELGAEEPEVIGQDKAEGESAPES